jgi:hypothetical protein
MMASEPETKIGRTMTLLRSSVSALRRGIILCGTCMVLLEGSLEAQREFPQVRVGVTELEGVWIKTPIAAIGTVTDIVTYGHQVVDQLPHPTMPGAHDLYWCQGYFNAIAVVKGALKEKRRKYLWGSTLSGCELVDSNPASSEHRSKTRLWFLREEGEFLRPIFDYGSRRFAGVFTPWAEGPDLPARQRMGALFLTPFANNDTLDDYARYLWNIGDIACELLGRTECIQRIRNLEGLGNAALRESACGFLKGQLKTDCDGQ